MSLRRFFYDAELSVNSLIKLDGATANKLINVLKKQLNDDIIVFNGKHGEYNAKIKAIKRNEVIIELLTFNAIDRISRIETNILIPLITEKNFDFMLQKATEFGVTNIYPIYTDRSKAKPNKNKHNTKLTRWKQIIISASEQCGLNILPKIIEPTNLMECVEFLAATNKNSINIAAHINSNIHIYSMLKNLKIDTINSMTFAIGPEGGFNQNEITFMLEKNFNLCSLGPRILRTETALICLMSMLRAIDI